MSDAPPLVVGHAQRSAGDPLRARLTIRPLVQGQLGRAPACAYDLDLLPGQPCQAERTSRRELRGKAYRQALVAAPLPRRIGLLSVGEDPLSKSQAVAQVCRAEAAGLDHAEPQAHDHRSCSRRSRIARSSPTRSAREARARPVTTRAATGAAASAYAHIPGKSFGLYAAEQIAQQVENGEGPIVSHVSARLPHVPDPFNIASLTVPRYEIVGAPGVKT